MDRRAFASMLTIVAAVVCAACGGGPRPTADLLAMHQPTPDPTLDAVVRDLPRALAGVPPTATPTPVVSLPRPIVRVPAAVAPTPTSKPAPPRTKPAASPASRR